MSETPKIEPLDYAPPSLKKPRPWRWILGGTLIALVLAAALLIPFSGTHSHAPWQRCSSNLRMLGLAMKMYANGNGGMFPPSWREVAIEIGYTTGNEFVCPAAYPMISPATGPTNQQVADAVADPAQRHNSYIYAGAGLNDNTVQPDEVLAFEWPADSTDGSANVLFADGHVERLDASPNGSDRAKYWNLQDDFTNKVRPLKIRP